MAYDVENLQYMLIVPLLGPLHIGEDVCITDGLYNDRFYLPALETLTPSPCGEGWEEEV